MHFCCYTGVVQQKNGGIYLSSPWMVSDEKRVIRIINSGVSEVPRGLCVEGFNINGRDKICSSKDDGFRGLGCGSQPLSQLQVSCYVRDKDIIMPIVAFSQLMPSDGLASSKVSLSSLTKVVSSLILALRARI